MKNKSLHFTNLDNLTNILTVFLLSNWLLYLSTMDVDVYLDSYSGKLATA